MDSKTRRVRRQEQLAALLREHFNDNQAALAESANIPATLVSRYLSGGKGIGEDMRNKIEQNTGFIGWFKDTPAALTAGEPSATTYHAPRMVALAPPSVTLDLDADCLVVWQQLQQLAPEDRERWRAELALLAAQTMVAKLPPRKTEPTTPPDKPRQPNPKAHDPA